MSASVTTGARAGSSAGGGSRPPRRRRPVAAPKPFDALFDTAPDGSIASPRGLEREAAHGVAAAGVAPAGATIPAAASGAAPPALHQRPAEGQTFDEIIAGAWEDLSAHRAVRCPVCRAAAMRPRYGAGRGAVGGRCGGCNSVIG